VSASLIGRLPVRTCRRSANPPPSDLRSGDLVPRSLLAVFVAAIVVTWALGEISRTPGLVASDQPMARSA
jgi:hypothetical protein